MAVLGVTKRKSDQISTTSDEEQQLALSAMSTQLAPRNGEGSQRYRSPIKKRRIGITAAQKQALIENLQLEITERARRLRSNYNLHAQSLRTRIEMRVNRIPMALRKLTMGELMERYEHQKLSASTGGIMKSLKDSTTSRPVLSRSMTAAVPSVAPAKRKSDEISKDKENELVEQADPSSKRHRGNTVSGISRPATSHALSLTTSNKTLTRSVIGSPTKATASRPAMTPGRPTLAQSVIEKSSKAPRPTPLSPRKTANPSVPPSSSTAGSTSVKRQRGATVTAAVASSNPPSSAQRPISRAAAAPSRTAQRRVSGTSESSENSTSTVIRRRPISAPPGSQPKLISTNAAASIAPATSSQKESTAGKTRTAVVAAVKRGNAGVTTTPSTTPATTTAAKKPAGAKLVGTSSSNPGGSSAAGRVLRKRA